GAVLGLAWREGPAGRFIALSGRTFGLSCEFVANDAQSFDQRRLLGHGGRHLLRVIRGQRTLRERRGVPHLDITVRAHRDTLAVRAELEILDSGFAGFDALVNRQREQFLARLHVPDSHAAVALTGRHAKARAWTDRDHAPAVRTPRHALNGARV